MIRPVSSKLRGTVYKDIKSYRGFSMLRAVSVVAGLTVLVAAVSGQQTLTPPAILMPADRLADSYRIYSSLLPLGETAGPNWPHDLLLIQDTTITVVPQNLPCNDSLSSEMNPHQAVHPSDGSRQDFAEILADFDRHCHDRLILDRSAFRVSTPVRLLNVQEQKEFQSTREARNPNTAAARKYEGAAALYAFSEVYFNAHHTVALVYATHWCGGLCGQGFWIALALKNGQWIPLPWIASHWISYSIGVRQNREA